MKKPQTLGTVTHTHTHTHRCYLNEEKGISLVSVLVTVILMLIILTSIIYSNNRTNEIKEAMLINSDIEELTKKVEVYYLEKETLPIDEKETEYRYFEEGKDPTDKETPVYYRLQISLLDNVTLNNKEILSEIEKQWYVINPETHTIYFVKWSQTDGNIKLQKAQYSDKNAQITLEAGNLINYNVSNSTGEVPNIGDTCLTPIEDNLEEDFSSIASENLYGELGENTGPGEPTKDSGKYNSVYDYVGYTYNWTPGKQDKTCPMVLHYDGIYNSLSGSTLSHSDSRSTWSDLSGNSRNGKLVASSTRKTISHEYGGRGFVSDSGWASAGNISFNENNANLSDGKFIMYDINSNNDFDANKKSKIPSGNEQYTIEIVYNHQNTKKGGLVGFGTYNSLYLAGTDGRNSFDGGGKSLGDWWDLGSGFNDVTKVEKIAGVAENYVGYRAFWRTNRAATVKSIYVETNGNGRSNALRTSDDGLGIRHYYWGNDLDTNNSKIQLTNKIHTITATYNGTNRQIFVDGKACGASDTATPNTLVKEITIGATDRKMQIKLDENGISSYMIYMEFFYETFLKSQVYSVRIYNKGLSAQEIYRNYIIDRERFNF